jgi:N-methylhydantoinase A
MLILGVDIGGTFTDLVLYDTAGHRMNLAKVPSEPGQEWLALENGLDELGVDVRQIEWVVHGTTVATNAILEHKLAKVALVTTDGFRDTLEIGRCMRLAPSLFDTRFARPDPLVERDVRFEAKERVAADGTVIEPLEISAIESIVRQVAAANPQAAAVCFINSFVNPQHEREMARALRAALPNITVSESHRVSPEIREYERFTTTVINGAVSPKLAKYLDNFEGALKRRGFSGTLLVMASNGGTNYCETMVENAAMTILSGPVGGVRGSIAAAEALDRPNLITLDMGGTSTEVALIDGGEPQIAHETVLNGFPLRLPQMNINSIGTGGGSIAFFDEGGGLHVGPRSAGAKPGPVCYGAGGIEPTITDANLLLGRLGSDSLAGGLHLDSDAARQAFEALAAKRGLPLMHLVEGIVAVSVTQMSNAIRQISIERGHDPREFSLVALGGAGPMHACMVAEDLGLQEVIVPPHPGHVCAYGLLASDLRQDGAQTWIRAWGKDTPAQLIEALQSLQARTLSTAAKEHWPAEKIRPKFAVDLRYAKQSHDVTVELPDLTVESVNRLPEMFESRHIELFGRAHKIDVMVRTIRVAITAEAPFDFRLLKPKNAATSAQRVVRPVWFSGTKFETPVIQRSQLSAGFSTAGPAVIAEYGATTIVPPNWEMHVAENSALVITRH